MREIPEQCWDKQSHCWHTLHWTSHGVSSTPCDRLGRDMLEDPGSVLYHRLKGLGSGGLLLPLTKNVGVVICVLCERLPGQHAGRAPSPREESRDGGGALLPTSTSSVVAVFARRATTTSRPPPWVAFRVVVCISVHFASVRRCTGVRCACVWTSVRVGAHVCVIFWWVRNNCQL